MELNHTIVWCHDNTVSSTFLTEVLGCAPAKPFLHFSVVALDNGVSLDFMEKAGDIAPQHYAFLVSESEFDALLDRLRTRRLDHWADPSRTLPGTINHHFSGRGVYFADPNGHLLEAITRPYGSEDALA